MTVGPDLTLPFEGADIQMETYRPPLALKQEGGDRAFRRSEACRDMGNGVIAFLCPARMRPEGADLR